jgi:heme d1 biosynthesis radical SAM protein NirJ
MFRLSRFLEELVRPTPARRREPSGPVVIWNLIRRCNLNCIHCYALSADVDFPGELSTGEILVVMEDLRAFGVPVLILSGGEPLLRPDLFEISRHAKALGFYLGLSSNGALIDERIADRIAEVGYDYVGVSLDGIGAVHDRFRRQEGAYARSLAGMRLLRDRGVKVGLRFTLTERNVESFTPLLDLMEEERIDKFYLSHLVYSGRGRRYRKDDAAHATTRTVMDALIERAWRHLREGRGSEFVTGNNDADGVYLLRWVERRLPEKAAHLRAHLEAWGGNASGVTIANIDNLGNVHPDTFWWHHSLGNVKERPFSRIWRDLSDPILAGLRRRPRAISGRCGRCPQFAICGGNTRIRALRTYGDPFAEDPGCYLTDAELGLEGEETARAAA